MSEREPWVAAPVFTPSREVAEDVLAARILVAITYPHGHPGVAGVDEGEGCPRCNAEKALDELLSRAATIALLDSVAEAARVLVDAEDAQDDPQSVYTAGEHLRAMLSRAACSYDRPACA